MNTLTRILFIAAGILGAFRLWAAGVPFASEPVTVLSPSDTGDYTLVANPGRASVAKVRSAGGKPLVLSLQFADEAYAFTNFAESASAVVFAEIPRAHLLNTWKLLGVKVLKNLPYLPEGSAGRFRREASFLAYKAGADGIWLPDADSLPPAWKTALKEAREDWRILVYLKRLADRAAASSDPFIRKEARRISYWFYFMPADYENINTLRLECVAYAKRLEGLLRIKAADLPVARSASIEDSVNSFMPYSDWETKPLQLKFSSNKLRESLDFQNGLSFYADYRGFRIEYSCTNGPPLPRNAMPGGTLDFRLYVPGAEPGTFLPYYFHCDLDPQWYSAERAPATGRAGFLFATDERFRPFSIAYGVRNYRVWTWPRLRDFGPEYPDPRPYFTFEAIKTGGWKVKLSFSWLSLYGFWPMQRRMKSDLWFIGLDHSPVIGGPVAGRVLWPKGSADNYVKFAAPLSTSEITDIYKEELSRSEKVWSTADAERFFPFAKSGKEDYARYDTASDALFYERMAHPQATTNENAWQLIWTDKEHPNPKFIKQSDNVKMTIWRKLDRMLYLSRIVSDLRLEYLEMRFAGKLPPELADKEDLSSITLPDEPDVDFDSEAIRLDDKEF